MEENEEFDSDFHSEDIPISEEFWNYMEHYWHNNREFPESTEASLNKKADLVDGKVPSSQLPSYVDDVLEFDSFENLPSSGEKGKIYLITNNNTQFRWSGSEYIQLNSDEYFMTTNTYQNITGRKDFHNNSGLNELGNNKLWAVGSNGSKAGISFYSEGMDTGNLLYDGDYHFLQGGNNYYKNIKSAGFVKENSNDDYILTGGGGHELKSNYLLSTEGNNRYFPRSTDSNSVIDLNNLTLEGVYYGYQWLNVPISTIATATVKIYSPDWIRQEYSPIDGSGVTYIRDRHNGTTWGDWKTVANRDWVTANFTTLDTEQYIPGTKWFITSGGNQYLNHGLRVLSQDGSNPGVVFYKEGANVGTIQYDGPNYLFTTSNTNAFANVVSAGFIKEGSNDDYFLTGGGSHKPVSDFVLSTQLGNYHNIDKTDSINNGSDSRPNKTWFDYNWAGAGYAGSVISFSGYPTTNYQTEIFGQYLEGGNRLGFRTRNGDIGVWNDAKWIWHTGNFNPDTKVNKSGDTMTGALNLMNLNSPVLNGSQIIHAGNADELYFGNPTVASVYFESGNSNLLHNRAGSGVGIIWDAHNLDPVTRNTAQQITGKKEFVGATGNDYTGAGIMINGNGIANTIYPTISFHQPGLYAGTVSYRDNEFYFMNINGNGFDYVRTAGFIKAASHDGFVLLGGGGHKPVSDFATSTDLSNYVTIHTPQTIIADKTFAPTSNISFYGNEENQVDVWKTSSGINTIVSGHVYHFYNTRWKVGNKRSDGAYSEGYAFQFSSNGGATYDEKVLITFDGNILTSAYGAASDWNAKVSQSQLSGYVNKSGDTMTGTLNALTISAQNGADKLIYDNIENFGSTLKINANASLGIQLQSNNNTKVLIDEGGISLYGNVNTTGSLNINSNSEIGRWKGADNNTNYLIWRNYSDTKDIAYIGADGNSAAAGGVGDGFAIVAPSGSLQLLASSVVTIQGYIPWTTGNFNPDLYLTERGINNNALVAETNFPLSITNYAGDPSVTNFQTYYGTSFHFKGPYGWYNRLDFPTESEKLFLSQGINTTNMSLKGYIPIIDTTVTNWTSLNLNPAQYVTQTSLNTQLGNYATLNGTQTFSGTNTFPQNIIIPFYPTLLEHAASYGFVADYIEQREAALFATIDADYVRSLENVKGLGFVGGTPDTPYVKHSNGTEVRVATETWSSNSFLTIYSDQNVTGIKTFTVSPKVPSAINPDEAVNLGQALELTEDRTNSRFLTRTTSGSSTYDLVGYGRPKMTNIICKGNGGFSLDIDGFEKGMTVKISNTTGQTIDVNFNNGSVSTAVDIKNWTEFHMDSEGDIIRTDANQATII